MSKFNNLYFLILGFNLFIIGTTFLLFLLKILSLFIIIKNDSIKTGNSDSITLGIVDSYILNIFWGSLILIPFIINVPFYKRFFMSLKISKITRTVIIYILISLPFMMFFAKFLSKYIMSITMILLALILILLSIMLLWQDFKKYKKIIWKNLSQRPYMSEVLMSLKTDYFINKVLKYIENSVPVVTGEWINTDVLRPDGKKFKTRLAKMEEKWLGLNK